MKTHFKKKEREGQNKRYAGGGKRESKRDRKREREVEIIEEKEEERKTERNREIMQEECAKFRGSRAIVGLVI